jgi:hypothetical protein
MALFHFKRAALLATAVFIGLPATSMASDDSPQAPQAAEAALAVVPQVQTGAHRLLTTYMNYGTGQLAPTLVAGFNKVHQPIAVNCSANGGCTVGIESTVQIQPSGGNWALCAAVDGVFANPPCPYQGHLPDTSLYVTGSGRQLIKVAKGGHTVQLYVYVNNGGGTLNNWYVDYRIYTP